MYRYLLLLFFLVPLLEVWLLVRVGSEIGPWWLVLSILATAVVGSFFLRLQGFATLRRAQQAMLSGQVPAGHLLEGVLLLLAGALLLTPGYATDLVGFLLLVPELRKRGARLLLARFLKFDTPAEDPPPRDIRTPKPENGAAGPGHGGHRGRRDPEVLEGEYTRED